MAQPMPRKSGRQTVEPDRLSPSELGGELQYGKNRALTVTNDPDPNTQEPAHKFKARETSASSYSPSRELGLRGEVCSARPFRQPCFKKEEQQEEGKAEETQKEVACAGGGAEEEAGGAALVGARVEVYWTGDCKWFAGVVDRYDAAHGYRISYADGDVKWHELDQPDEKWRVLAPAPSPAHVMPLIHSRVRVWWTGRWGGWYAGRVVSVRRSRSGASLVKVAYDDDETKTHDLSGVRWQVLDDDDDDDDLDLITSSRVVDLISDDDLPDDDDDVRWLEIEGDVPELLTGNAVRYRPLWASYDLEPASLPPLELPDEAEGEELNELYVELCDSVEYLEMMPAIDSPCTSSSPSSCGQRDEAGVVSGYGGSDEDEAEEEEAEEEAEDEAEALLPASLPRPFATLLQEGPVLRTSAEISRLLATMV